ncbi:exodeoxyribonuclease VII large subunit [Tepidimonas taiwanensis]|uniref:Exodeoxyribonuclease 7 large subunit n=1 Tax=Tepidimonas taiwanensis TaxID=307486 RepID=A0A554XBC8_9BURK|nr:exodeoxyribonuclease VII large subunit [Tepidimonas taiwanensis]TSE33140.1 Exodeoxyribonuclease 7 large subunit [Tepidimonas taiwanensis]UBQ05955.1 exodeoxyribonuclease VII large subunit [Tepidimonas taiwanensis]
MPATDRAAALTFPQAFAPRGGAAADPDDPPAWPVGALVAAVADALRARFNPVRVAGEVAGCQRAASGHVYFTLKDEQGQLRCALFRRAAEASPVALRDGLRIEALGRLDVYAPRGDLQLIVERVRLAGQGALYEAFLRLKAQLAAEGLFDAARKRPLPPYPTSIGVVTSLEAAALRDVATTLARRVPHLPVWLYPAPVQGVEAPARLCAALQRAYDDHRRLGRPSVLLVVRGGGSLEDLWAFNDPALVRLLARAPMPVVVGVGHETDFTLADFVADLRAPTPTAAAELCAPAAEALRTALARWQERATAALWRRLDTAAQRLDRVAQRLGRPSAVTGRERARLQTLEHRMQRAAALRTERVRQQLERLAFAWRAAAQRETERRGERLARLADAWQAATSSAIDTQWQRLARAQTQLALLDPQRVVQRGYALVTDAAGHVLTDARRTRPGDALHVTLAAGRLDARVETVHLDPPH